MEIKPKDYGVRSQHDWCNYAEPLQFNVIVNNMSAVKRHQDCELARTPRFDIQSSCCGTFREQLHHTKKGL